MAKPFRPVAPVVTQKKNTEEKTHQDGREKPTASPAEKAPFGSVEGLPLRSASPRPSGQGGRARLRLGKPGRFDAERPGTTVGVGGEVWVKQAKEASLLRVKSLG